MIPIIDDYLQALIVTKLRLLKENPKLIEYLFSTARPETISQLQSFITTQKLRVVIGFPREQSTLPAYVITMAPETEQPSGLGDNLETFGEVDWGLGEEPDQVAQQHIDAFLASTFMNSTYRIECWSDNGDFTAYMYCVLKWCLLTSRSEMLKMGWSNITLSGTDLEPVPDYMPIFVYRRSAQITMVYDNIYQDGVTHIIKYIDVVNNPEKYEVDKQNNIIDENGEIVIPYHQGTVFNVSSYIRK